MGLSIATGQEEGISVLQCLPSFLLCFCCAPWNIVLLLLYFRIDCLYTLIGTLFQNKQCLLFNYLLQKLQCIHHLRDPSPSSWFFTEQQVHTSLALGCSQYSRYVPPVLSRGEGSPPWAQFLNAASDLFVEGDTVCSWPPWPPGLPVFQHGDPQHEVPWGCSLLVQNLHLLLLKFMGFLF